MKTRISLFTLATVFATPVFADPQAYLVDPHHTYPRFEYNHFGFSNQIQRFNKTSGTIVFDRAEKTGSVNIAIDARSVDSGYPLLNEHLQGEDFFDSAKFPLITYKSTAVRFEGDKPVAVDGNLTIKGITRPVTLTVTSFQAMPNPMLKREALGANAVAKIKRSDFNAGKYAPNVSDEVTLSIAVEAIQQ